MSGASNILCFLGTSPACMQWSAECVLFFVKHCGRLADYVFITSQVPAEVPGRGWHIVCETGQAGGLRNVANILYTIRIPCHSWLCMGRWYPGEWCLQFSIAWYLCAAGRRHWPLQTWLSQLVRDRWTARALCVRHGGSLVGRKEWDKFNLKDLYIMKFCEVLFLTWFF